MPGDDERIGLSSSTPIGQELRFAGALSGQTGWRRKAAYVIAVGWLATIAVGVVAAAVVVLR